jgi:hypothetical protein
MTEKRKASAQSLNAATLEGVSEPGIAKPIAKRLTTGYDREADPGQASALAAGP